MHMKSRLVETKMKVTWLPVLSRPQINHYSWTLQPDSYLNENIYLASAIVWGSLPQCTPVYFQNCLQGQASVISRTGIQNLVWILTLKPFGSTAPLHYSQSNSQVKDSVVYDSYLGGLGQSGLQCPVCPSLLSCPFPSTLSASSLLSPSDCLREGEGLSKAWPAPDQDYMPPGELDWKLYPNSKTFLQDESSQWKWKLRAWVWKIPHCNMPAP